MNHRRALRILNEIERKIHGLPGTVLVTKATLRQLYLDHGVTRSISEPLYELTRKKSLQPVVQYEKGSLIDRKAPIQQVWSHGRLVHHHDKDRGRELFYCVHCGTQYSRGTAICTKCGKRVVATD
jgi:hypothetical protein